jgi:hypothetical protein
VGFGWCDGQGAVSASGWLAPRSGFSYAPVLAIAGSLHIVAFVVLLTMVRSLQLLPIR